LLLNMSSPIGAEIMERSVQARVALVSESSSIVTFLDEIKNDRVAHVQHYLPTDGYGIDRVFHRAFHVISLLR
jgi:hypothetical protein